MNSPDCLSNMLVKSLTANCVVLSIVCLAVDTPIPHHHASSSADTLPLHHGEYFPS